MVRVGKGLQGSFENPVTIPEVVNFSVKYMGNKLKIIAVGGGQEGFNII